MREGNVVRVGFVRYRAEPPAPQVDVGHNPVDATVSTNVELFGGLHFGRLLCEKWDNLGTSKMRLIHDQVAPTRRYDMLPLLFSLEEDSSVDTLVLFRDLGEFLQRLEEMKRRERQGDR